MFIVAVALVIIGGGAIASVVASPVQYDGTAATVVFVCRNGVSMSVWSAAYFNRLAVRRGLTQRATSRSALPPSAGVPIRMRVALAIDGFRLDGYQPQMIASEDARRAEHVIVIEGGTTLPSHVQVPAHATTEQWQGFPAMRDEYFASRSELRRRVEALVEQLSANKSEAR
jgi:protein-tyrosine-phosphatase